jgi:hypothetical protein
VTDLPPPQIDFVAEADERIGSFSHKPAFVPKLSHSTAEITKNEVIAAEY